MPIVSDYVTFGDTSVVLEIGADIDTVMLPSNLDPNSNAVMTVSVGGEGDVDNLLWNMTGLSGHAVMKKSPFPP